MKTTLIALTAIATIAHAELPVVETFDPSHSGGYYPGTVTVNGINKEVRLHSFGSQQAAAAQEFGRQLAPMYYSQPAFDSLAFNKGLELYHSSYFAHCFDVVAKNAYKKEMQRKID